MPQFVYKEVILNSCSDIDCHMFHDCVKHVESVTFLTLSYRCKLLKNKDFQFSPGILVIVLKARWTKLKLFVACFLTMLHAKSY